MPIQQMLLGVGAVATKTYVDDVFSTFLYTGNATARSINTGVDMSKGGMTWIKSRSHSLNGNIFSSNLVDGNGTYGCLQTTDTDAAGYSNTGSNAMLTAFNNNGFSLGADGSTYRVNGGTLSGSVPTYSSWSFRKSPGFFDVVNWTGNGTAGRQISHSLSSIPGCIMVKCTTDSRNWAVYHRGMGNGKAMALDTTSAQHNSTTYWNDTDPTASVFTVGTANDTNKSGETYVAYLFAGGSTNSSAVARSVGFDGSDDYLSLPASSDLDAGSGDLTIECYFKIDPTINSSNYYYLFSKGFGQQIAIHQGKLKCWFDATDTYDGYEVEMESHILSRNEWHHGAITRSGNTWRLFVNGVQVDSATANFTPATTSSYTTCIGAGDFSSPAYFFKGNISNFRYVKGTAVYTSSFISSESLTNITNTKLLCCNDSSTTGSTVTPGTITANGSPTASTESPQFDDPAAYIFGENEDKSVIKTGSYVGDGNGGSNQGVANSQEIFLGWEPQWILIKRSSAAESWILYDSMRGISNVSADSADAKFELNFNDAESLLNHINLTSTGFTFTTSNNQVNSNGDDYVFVAIRRSDGYVGKPPELGTDVFAMDYGNASSTSSIATYDSGFPVDFSIRRQPATSESWYASSRLIGTKSVKTDTTDAEGNDSNLTWDRNDGVGKWSGDLSSYLMWQWKRHAGFDVVAFTGVSGTQAINHGLSKVPEMFVVKRRDNTGNWYCYHKGLNGGTNPEQWRVAWNSSAAADQSAATWSNTAPTATQFTTGTHSDTGNVAGATYIAMLFASVDGISKVGYYSGNGSSGQTITTGFQPRFLIIKNRSASNNWFVLDTTRGWGSGNDNYLMIDQNDAQDSHDFGAPTSTGFTLVDGNSGYNQSGNHYIYYAHA